MITIGIAIVIVSVIYMGKLLQLVMKGKAKKILDAALGEVVGIAILTGALLTILGQSSSTTTSLAIPLAGAGVLTLRQIFPFTMGANIGTTVTALLAASAVSGPNSL